MSCCPAAVSAQVTPDGGIEAQNTAAAYTDGKITVSMQLDAAKAALHRTESIVLTQVIKAVDKERALTPVIVSGRSLEACRIPVCNLLIYTKHNYGMHFECVPMP